MKKTVKKALWGHRMAVSVDGVTQHSVVAVKPVYRPVGSIATHADLLGHLGHWGISEGARHSTPIVDAGGGLGRPCTLSGEIKLTNRLQREASHAG